MILKQETTKILINCRDALKSIQDQYSNKTTNFSLSDVRGEHLKYVRK